MFGGFLLLGGRAADLLGRRPVFFAGLSLFAAASLANALAPSSGTLVVSRGLQGLGAAMTAPAALSIVAVTFTDEAERTKAFAIWQSLGAAGAAAGVVLGGVLTDLLGWRWIFSVNLPVAAFAIAYLLRNLRLPTRRIRRGFDLVGAVVVTAGLLVLVYTLLETDRRGWASAETLGGLAFAAGLLGAFVWIEWRSANPLVRLRFFVHRQRNTAIGTQLPRHLHPQDRPMSTSTASVPGGEDTPILRRSSKSCARCARCADSSPTLSSRDPSRSSRSLRSAGQGGNFGPMARRLATDAVHRDRR